MAGGQKKSGTPTAHVPPETRQPPAAPPVAHPTLVIGEKRPERATPLLATFASLDVDPDSAPDGGTVYGYAQAHRNRDRLLRAPLAPRFVRGRDLVRLAIAFALVASIIGTTASFLPDLPPERLAGDGLCIGVIAAAFYVLARFRLGLGWRIVNLSLQLAAAFVGLLFVLNGSTYLYTVIPFCVVVGQIQAALRNHVLAALLLTGGGLLVEIATLLALDTGMWDGHTLLSVILVVVSYLFVVVSTRLAIRDMVQRRRLLAVLGDLRRSEERYRIVTERANDAIYILDPDGTVSFANRRMSDMLGLAGPQTLIGKPFADLLAAEDRKRFQDSLRAARDGENVELPAPVQSALLRADGTRLIVEINAVSFFESSIFKGRVSIARNITERRRMQEQIERRNRDLAVLNAVGSVASRSLNLDTQLNDVVNTLVEIFSAEVVAISLAETQSGLLRVAAWRGLDPHQIGAATSLKLGEGLAGNVAQSGTAMLLDDISRNATLAAPAAALGLRSYMGAPIRADDQLLGVVNVYSRRHNAFSRDDLGLLVSIANQLGLSIEKARLYGTSVAQVRELRCLAEIAKAINVSQSLEETLNAIAEAISLTLTYRAATILLTDASLTLATAHGSYGLPPTYASLLRTAPQRNDPAMHNSAMYRAIRQREPVFARLDDMADAPGFKTSPLAARIADVGWQAVIAVPLVYKDEVLGVLACYSTAEAEPPATELRLLTTIANQTSLAVRNSALYQAQQRRADQLRTLNEINQHIGAILSADELMPYVTRILHETFDYYNVAIFLIAADDPRQLVLKAASGWEADRLPPGTTLDRDGRSVNAWVAQHGEPALLTDVSTDERYMETVTPGVIHAELVVPVRVSGGIVGTLDIQSSQLGAFDALDVTIMQAMADQVGVALHNAKLYEEQRRRADQLRTVNEVSKKIAAILRPSELLPFIAHSVAETFSYQHISIFLLDADGHTLVLHAVTEQGNGNLDITARLDTAGPGIVAAVARTGEPLLVNDVTQHPLYVRITAESAAPTLTNAELAVPIRSANRVVGVLNIESAARNAFDAIDLTVAQTLAEQIGIALENARLYSEVNRIVSQLKEANADLEEATRHKSQFLANMSHELRTPLNAIIGFSEILQDQTFGPLNDRQRRYVTNILTSGRHLLTLVNDILDLAKVEAGRMELHIETFAPAEAIAEVENIVAGSAMKKNIQLHKEIAGALPLLNADKGKFKQVLYNLLSNAVKFTPDDGTITVRARITDCETIAGTDASPAHRGHGSGPGRYIEIAVSDTGIGIKPEDQTSIFEEFRQVENSFSRQYQGTGLGLALSRQLIELHGGRLWVESEIGVGSTFTFSVPLVPPDHAKANDAPLYFPALTESAALPPAIVWAEGFDGPPATHRGLALVVEDDDKAADVLALYLSQYGYSVTRLRSGDAVNTCVRDMHPAVVTLDVVLPHKNGWDILRELKADPHTSAVPVLVISIVDNPDLSRSLGAAAMLVKPLDRATLFARLDLLAPVS